MSQSSATQAQPNTQTSQVLLVDTDSTFFKSLGQHMAADSRASMAQCDSLAAATQRLQNNNISLVLVNPDLLDAAGGGLKTWVDFVRKEHPETQIALMSDKPIDDYLPVLMDCGLANMVSKITDPDCREVHQSIHHLLAPQQAIGLAPYLGPEATFQTFTIKNSDEIIDVLYEIKALFNEKGVENIEDVATALIEALTNAVYYGTRNPDGSQKYQKATPIAKLEPEEYVPVQVGWDSERIGVSIQDRGGKLSIPETLHWLHRQVTGEGILDTHGRGFFLMHVLMDRLVVNIRPDQMTEILVFQYFKNVPHGVKPLHINLLK